MDAAIIKEAISRTYPVRMTYRQAKRLRVGNGRFPQSLKRSVGFSDDHFLSVELIGASSKRLTRLDFMLGLHDVAKAASAAVAIVASIKAVYPDWDGERWFMGQVARREEGQNGRVSVSFQTILDVPILFVRVVAR
jgi:hypothetical protein